MLPFALNWKTTRGEKHSLNNISRNQKVFYVKYFYLDKFEDQAAFLFSSVGKPQDVQKVNLILPKRHTGYNNQILLLHLITVDNVDTHCQ